MTLQVMLVNPAGQKKGYIPYRECTLVQRHLAVGTWTITCPLTEHTVQAAAPGWSVHITGPGLPDATGGPVDEHTIKLGADQSGKRKPPELVLTGPDDMTVLADRLAYPVPGSAADNQSSAAFDVRSGTASTIIRQYIDVNAGPSALVARRVPGMTLAADPAIGGTTAGQARFTNLLELVAKIAENANLSVRVVRTSTTAREVRIAAVTDLTGPARFSVALNNLRSVTYRRGAPAATFVVGGGRGEETARTFVIRQNTTATNSWRYREGFYDYRSAESGTGELERGTEKQLAESAERQELELVPIDSPVLRYGADYGLGSLVTVEVWPGIVVDQVVREVELTAQRGWVQVQPRAGTPGVGQRPSSRTVAEMARRLAQLERGV